MIYNYSNLYFPGGKNPKTEKKHYFVFELVIIIIRLVFNEVVGSFDFCEMLSEETIQGFHSV
jgi:hypothetical protein